MSATLVLQHVDMVDENRMTVAGILLRCEDCFHEVEAVGQSLLTRRECLKELNLVCPKGPSCHDQDELDEL